MDNIKRVNAILGEALERLHEGPYETPYPYGPLGGNAVPGPDGMDDTIGSDDIPDDFDFDELSPEVEAFDAYVGSILDKLISDLEVSDEDSWDLFVQFADIMAEKGELPEFPSDSIDSEFLVAWMNAAKTSGFETKLMKYAEGEVEDITGE